jgi:mannose-6-phosphate isomerase-like protein (cupin superfamily)
MWKVSTVVLVVCFVATLTAQRMPIGAAFLTGGEIGVVREKATGDIQMLVSDAGKYNVGLATMRRKATGQPERPIVHAQVTEVYYVTDGSAVISTGGTVTDAQNLPADNNVVKVLAGPTTMGGTLHNAEKRSISKGDFVVIPPGVQHSFDSIDGSIEYLIIRIDADHVLPAGLLHDIVRSTREKAASR